MKLLRQILVVMTLITCAAVARGQCGNVQVNYTASDSVSANSVNLSAGTTNWTYTILVDGNSQMTQGPYPPCFPVPPSLSHQPYVYLDWNGTPVSNGYGTAVCYSCWLYYQPSISTDFAFGTQFTADGGAQVNCQAKGVIFLVILNNGGGSSGKHFESASTLVQNTDPPNGGSDCNTSGLWFQEENSFVLPMFMPHYNGNSEIATCFYPVQDWCTNTPDANYNNTRVFMPRPLIAGTLTDDSQYFPQKGGYYLTLVQALWRIGSTWHTLGGVDQLSYGVDPHYNTTSMSQVGCTSTPSTTSVSATFGPQS